MCLMNKQTMKRLTINLPNELHRKLKMKAASEQTTITDIIINSLGKI